MGIRVTSVSDTKNKDVFTNTGMYCGKVEDVECDLNRFKLRSIIVNALRGSYLTNMLGSKKGVIIPFPMVEAIGDIIIIKNISGPLGTREPINMSEEATETPEPAEPETTPTEPTPSAAFASFE